MYGDGYSRLGFAIVEQAVKDYRKEANRLKRNHKNEEAYNEIMKLEEFFRSDWCDYLLQDRLCGETIIKQLRKEYGDDIYVTRKERIPEPAEPAKTESGKHGKKSRRI